MAAAPGNGRLQSLLQSAVQSVRWTYSLFWQLCPRQGMLVWSEGYYNGAIKTRKTVQATEVSAEEASLHRSQQIRELYDSLSANAEDSNGGAQQPFRRPSAALSPEDLTESEWFYLMCISFSFPPGAGLPGKAYAKRQHIWLTGANEVDSKVFSRAILAKSARIQTVVCIPLMEGVVELGTTERVKEDYEFIQHMKNHFMDPQRQHPRPALSEHSSSEPPPPPPQFHSSTVPSHHHQADVEEEEDDNEEEEEEEDDDEEEEEDGENEVAELESEGDADASPKTQSDHFMAEADEEEEAPNMINIVANDYRAAATTDVAAASELMQLDMSESIRLGTPDDSTDLDSDFHSLHKNHHQQINPHSSGAHPIHGYPTTFLPHQEDPLLEELSQEDTHYSETISTILRHQCGQWAEYSTTVAGDSVAHSPNSAFSRCTTTAGAGSTCSAHRSSQRLLKFVLLTVPFLHAKSFRGVTANLPSKLWKATTTQEEPNANHVLAERRRREKLNERFVILRSLVPFVTKMDKASILGDTIEYVKQLRRKIQELEARGSQSAEVARNNTIPHAQRSGALKTRMGPRLNTRTAERGRGTANDTEEDSVVQVEVSIIESDALVELRCPSTEGLILDVMLTLRELGIEITTVQSSVNGGTLFAELRAKLKENMKGKKANIVEVKKAIHSIIPEF